MEAAEGLEHFNNSRWYITSRCSCTSGPGRAPTTLWHCRPPCVPRPPLGEPLHLLQVALFHLVPDKASGVPRWLYLHQRCPHSHDVRCLAVLAPDSHPLLISGGCRGMGEGTGPGGLKAAMGQGSQGSGQSIIREAWLLRLGRAGQGRAQCGGPPVGLCGRWLNPWAGGGRGRRGAAEGHAVVVGWWQGVWMSLRSWSGGLCLECFMGAPLGWCLLWVVQDRLAQQLIGVQGGPWTGACLRYPAAPLWCPAAARGGRAAGAVQPAQVLEGPPHQAEPDASAPAIAAQQQCRWQQLPSAGSADAG